MPRKPFAYLMMANCCLGSTTEPVSYLVGDGVSVWGFGPWRPSCGLPCVDSGGLNGTDGAVQTHVEVSVVGCQGVFVLYFFFILNKLSFSNV